MQILVRFPKDKEEIQKKRMAAMMKKLQNSGSSAPIDLSGREGERKLKEINVELTQYYQEQKAQQLQGPCDTLRTLQRSQAHPVDPGSVRVSGLCHDTGISQEKVGFAH